ncbi:RsmG family class I SAM-dependent methyltransferase [Psychrosphaera aquimarina]
MGSGAGFPGIVTAVCLGGTWRVAGCYLIESNQKKAAFLRNVYC